MPKRSRNDTLYLRPELCSALIKEIGVVRFEEATARKKQQIYLWSRIGCPIIYGKYLLLKYPHLLTWSDFGITCEEDLGKFQEYVGTLKEQADQEAAQRKAARAARS